jgi:hypothetical protein
MAPSDFYLFDNLKQKLQAVAVTERDSLIPAITQILYDTPPCALIVVYQIWTRRFR